jgi:D-lactate dehydrogenase (cytochrome)
VEEIADILTAHGGTGLRIAQTEAERQQIWYGRKSAAGALSRLAPNFYLVDITVPRSRLADTLAAVNAVTDRYGLTVGHVFHAGDGNLHPCISFDGHDADETSRVFQACEEIVRLCVERDGSITGEHGVGIEKRAYMPMMYSGSELAAMTEIKALFDPATLLNPGKIFPAELPPAHYETPVTPTGDLFAPASAAEAAGGLVALSAAGKTVRMGGAATGDRQGAALWLTTAQLQGIIRFAPDDLYVTVGAGLPLAELQSFLAERQMQVPLMSPWPQATVGGLVAANVNSPQRLRYGGVRDLLLATTVALADGRVIRAGRPVVKNVAGYDLPKLFAGSFGVLGLLTDVTLKLLPRPRSRRSFALPVDDPATGLAWATATAPVWLLTAGVTLCQGASRPGAPAAPYRLAWTLEGPAEDVAAEWQEISVALQAIGALSPVEIDETERNSAASLWAEFVAAAPMDGLLVRVGAAPGRLLDYWRHLSVQARTQASWCFDVGSHLAYAAYAAPDATSDAVDDAVAAAAWLRQVRLPAEAMDGYAVVMQAPPVWRNQLDRRGRRPDTLNLAAALKARWDPAHILNPGEFVAG